MPDLSSDRMDLDVDSSVVATSGTSSFVNPSYVHKEEGPLPNDSYEDSGGETPLPSYR